MASLKDTFNLDKLPESSFDLIPDGWYQAMIVKGEIKETKNQTGEYINFRFDIIGPTHQGRCVYSVLNIKNQSAEAERIGRQQLGDIMRAVGLTKATDTDQFLGQALQIKLGSQKETEGRQASNKIIGYKALTGSVPAFQKPKEKEAEPEKANSKAFWTKK